MQSLTGSRRNKVTLEVAHAARADYQRGSMWKVLMEKYDVSTRTLHRILSGSHPVFEKAELKTTGAGVAEGAVLAGVSDKADGAVLAGVADGAEVAVGAVSALSSALVQGPSSARSARAPGQSAKE